MTEMTSAGTRDAQLAAVLSTLAQRPGRSAYALTAHVPVQQPGPAEQRRTGVLAVSAPLDLVLDLLRELSGKTRSTRHPARATGPSGTCKARNSQRPGSRMTLGLRERQVIHPGAPAGL